MKNQSSILNNLQIDTSYLTSIFRYVDNPVIEYLMGEKTYKKGLVPFILKELKTLETKLYGMSNDESETNKKITTALREKALRFEKTKNYDAAVACYEDSLKCANDDDVAESLTRVLTQAKQLKLHDKSDILNDDQLNREVKSYVLQIRAKFLEDNGYINQSIINYTKARDLAPDDELVVESLIRVLKVQAKKFENEKQYVRAIANYRKVIGLDEKDFDTHLDLARLHEQNNDFFNAEICYKYLIENNYDYFEIFVSLATLLKKMGCAEESQDIYSMAYATTKYKDSVMGPIMQDELITTDTIDKLAKEQKAREEEKAREKQNENHNSSNHETSLSMGGDNKLQKVTNNEQINPIKTKALSKKKYYPVGYQHKSHNTNTDTNSPNEYKTSELYNEFHNSRKENKKDFHIACTKFIKALIASDVQLSDVNFENFWGAFVTISKEVSKVELAKLDTEQSFFKVHETYLGQYSNTKDLIQSLYGFARFRHSPESIQKWTDVAYNKLEHFNYRELSNSI